MLVFQARVRSAHTFCLLSEYFVRFMIKFLVHGEHLVEKLFMELAKLERVWTCKPSLGLKVDFDD